MKFAGSETITALIAKVKEALGTKLDKTDVVDDLTTEDSKKALSAAQGKKLSDMMAASGNGDMMSSKYDPDGDGKVTSAVSADTAAEATHATSADTANEATHAASATSAESADEATHAASATSADTAASADSASEADSAKNAEKLGGKLPADYLLGEDMVEMNEEDITSLWGSSGA